MFKRYGSVIGNAYLTDINYIHRTANSHVLIGEKDFWGKGYAKEALLMLVNFAFKERGINRISALVLEDNRASIRMLEKCGYIQEGILRQSVFKNGKFKNQIIMSILNKSQNE